MQKSSFLSLLSYSLSLSLVRVVWTWREGERVLSWEDKSVSERKIKLSDQWVLTAAGDATIRRGEKYLVRETCCRWRRTMHTNRSCLSRQLCLRSSRGKCTRAPRWVRERNKSSASWSSLGTSEEESDPSFTNRTRP